MTTAIQEAPTSQEITQEVFVIKHKDRKGPLGVTRSIAFNIDAVMALDETSIEYYTLKQLPKEVVSELTTGTLTKMESILSTII